MQFIDNFPKPDYQRAILQQIDFSQKMIALIGAKGVGKTTESPPGEINMSSLSRDTGINIRTLRESGKNKDFSQIKNMPNSYLAIDDIELGDDRKILLWLLGLLY
jgi:hypothetical protein